jgi:hypothetical protein
MNIDDTIKNVLGKNKNTKSKVSMFSFKTNTSTFNNPIKNVMNTIRTTSVIPKISSMPGASLKMQNQWKSFSPTQKNILRSRLPDSDGDRIPDKYDCQPKNVMRQDDVSLQKLVNEIRNSPDMKQLVVYIKSKKNMSEDEAWDIIGEASEYNPANIQQAKNAIDIVMNNQKDY